MIQDILEVFCYFIMRIFNVKNKICQQDIIFFIRVELSYLVSATSGSVKLCISFACLCREVVQVFAKINIVDNLVMMMLTKYGDFKGHPPLEGLVPAPLLPSPAVVLVAVPDHTVVV